MRARGAWCQSASDRGCLRTDVRRRSQAERAQEGQGVHQWLKTFRGASDSDLEDGACQRLSLSLSLSLSHTHTLLQSQQMACDYAGLSVSTVTCWNPPPKKKMGTHPQYSCWLSVVPF